MSLSTKSVGGAHLSDSSLLTLTARTDIGDRMTGLGGLFAGLGDEGKPYEPYVGGGLTSRSGL